MHGAKDICWAQPAAASGHALTLNLLGTKEKDGSGGLSISLAWRRGSLDEQVVQRFKEGFEKILRLLKEGEEKVVRENITFGELRRMV